MEQAKPIKGNQMYNLSGKVAIVTGSGRAAGLGQGIAKRLAHEGASIAVVDICRPYESAEGKSPIGRASWDELLDRKKEIEALGVKSLAVKCDCTDEEDVNAMVTAVVKEFGRIDILCNNVGMGAVSSMGLLVDVDAAGWDVGMTVNFKTTHLVSRAVAKQMIAQGTGGKIVNTSSQAGLKPGAMVGIYCSAKAAVIMHTKVLALELASFKINVNAVCPGTIETESLKESFEWLANKYMEGATYEQAVEAGLPPIPLGRLQTPEDVANAVVWLASPEADYITGVALLTTGGQTIS
jgi:NAD(P)-dependent dehydrogenase (short-subunit alcohol dehydrogenase family)